MNNTYTNNSLEIELFLLDMDGTIYLDNELFDGSLDFINTLIKKNIRYVFLTNNSSSNLQNYVDKLTRIGVPATKDNIFTSGMAMGVYLNENYPNQKVYLVGTKSLYNELLNYNINLVEDNPDIVVIGFDRELTYEKLEKACKFIDDGAIFLATNPDYVCPTEFGSVPDCGSVCDMLYNVMITNATKKKPNYIGKPSPMMINLLKNKYKIDKEKIAMVGDRVYTDIMSGYNAGVKTICVLSGESTIETVENSEIKPDYVLNSVKDIIPLLK